mgnify:FL=1
MLHLISNNYRLMVFLCCIYNSLEAGTQVLGWGTLVSKVVGRASISGNLKGITSFEIIYFQKFEIYVWFMSFEHSNVEISVECQIFVIVILLTAVEFYKLRHIQDIIRVH